MRTTITALLFLAGMPTMASASTLRGLAQNNSNNGGGNRQNNGNNGVGNGRATTCTTNSDCGQDRYCAAGQCLAMGSCETEWDCRNPSNSYPVIECTGPLVCNQEKQCGRECGPTCSDGTHGVPCLVTPCTYAEGFCDMEFTQCTNDFCGGCNALVFNDAGNHEMCTLPGKFVETQSCTSSADCGNSKYCSQGVCIESGQCSSDSDCFNPDNVYATVQCVGPISCDLENGQCGRTCSDSNCPADQPEVQCFASTCDTLANTCQDEIANCVDYYCGGCGAFAFDKAGFQVCNDPSPKSCNSTKDCGESEYCSQGLCTEAGKCSNDADCFNPENIYASILCVGPISCDLENGQCGRTCSDSNCPADKPEVQCLASTCATLGDTCQDDIANCVDYDCGDCGAFAFDKAGFQVCNVPTPLTACSSTADCAESEYCSQGLCTEAGKCSSDADCFNPENVYASVLCVGPISCDLESGQCGRTCSDSNCPADKPEVQCLASTCETLADTCEDEITNCVDYSCGDCGAFAFDKTGYQVCKSCSSANDCAEGEYCAGGKCKSDGKCGTDVDCLNPTNMYPVILCVGALSCQESGMCGVECGASNCPNGEQPANCLVEPCRYPPSCQESWEYCINDYCGGCGVILLDAAGNEVTCTPV